MSLTPAASRSHSTVRTPLAIVAAASMLLLGGTSAFAQLPVIRLYSVFPTGAKAGATVELQVTSGADLEELDKLLFNHPGITAAPKTQDVNGKPQPVQNTFLVTVASDVAPGSYEIRAGGLFGISNPRTFVVGTREEAVETEPNNSPAEATAIPLNATVNGRSNGNADVDWLKFPGKKGQRVLVECRSVRIDSRMAPTVEVQTAAGQRLGYGRALGRTDPMVDVTLPADGEYLLKVHDFIYGGGNEYVYRLTVSTEPHVDFVMPPAGQPGTNGSFTLYGRNLPGGTPAGIEVDGRPLEKLAVNIPLPAEGSTLKTLVNLPPAEAGVDAISYIHRGPTGASNPVMIYLATAPVTLEAEPNEDGKQAQKLNVPCEVAGQFQARGDVDTFSFAAKAGEVYYLEVYGERSGSTSDPYLVLEQVTKNDKGEETLRRITALDDDATNIGGNAFDTRNDDPVYRFQVPADGEYRVTLRDRYFESRGDPRLIYRLAVRKEQPDFRLVAVPVMPVQQNQQMASTWTIGLRKGENVAVSVYSFRRDGFDGTIDVWAEDLPAGVTAKGAAIGPGSNSADLIFMATEDAAPWSGHIRILGKARIEDPEKVRALAAAKAAVKPAADAVPKFTDASKKAEEALAKANEALAKAKEAAAQKPDDANLAKQVEQTQKAADDATAAAKKAADELAAAMKAVADAEAAVKTAEQQVAASAKELAREARSGTIVWPGQNNRPSTARVSQSIGLSVLNEKAPIQITTDVFKVEANQSRQILIPVKVARREGFDNNVNLTFDGLPNNTNIQVENKAVEKGKDEQLLRVFVNNNAKVGTYTVYLKGQAQVQYRRNPEAAERAKAEQTTAAKAAEDAANALKQAQQTLQDTTKKAAEAAEALKKATAAKVEAEKKQAAAAEAEKKAAEELQKAADDAKAAAQAKLNEAQAAAKKAAEELAAAQKAETDATAASKAAEEAKVAADTAAKEADAKSKAAAAAKQAADKRATDTANASRPQNVNIFPPSTPMIIEVKPAPATLAANVPNGGAIKRGDKLEVKVSVNRLNNFAGPVTLTLPLPPGVTGLSAPPVTIPADAKEGVLTIQAAGDATEGQLANMVVRGEMEFEGKAAVDVPVTLKVNK